MNSKLNVLFAIFFIVSLSATSNANENTIMNVSPKYCEQGIYKPNDGDFSVYIFCDDALGTQIGIILTRAGGGQVLSTGNWSLNDRFWQKQKCMSDIITIVWSKSGNFLYTITSEIYNEEGLYEIDLRNKKSIKLFDGKNSDSKILIEHVENNSLTVNGIVFEIKQ